MTHLVLGSTPLTLNQLRGVIDGPVTVEVAPSAWTDVDKSAATVAAIIAEGRTVYGINTGFGLWPAPRSPPAILRRCKRTWCSAMPAASVRCWMMRSFA